jgi:hypothetical protein
MKGSSQPSGGAMQRRSKPGTGGPTRTPPLLGWKASSRMLVVYFFSGLKDALLAWPHSFLVLYLHGSIRRLTLTCFLLNGRVFHFNSLNVAKLI